MGLQKSYLILYNLVELLGWAAVCGLSVFHFVSGGSLTSLHGVSGDLMYYVQWSAILEILHALLHIVPAPIFTTIIQVFSRVGVVVVLHFLPETRFTVGLPMLTFAWSITEIVRYLYYALHTLAFEPSLLVWLRYSTFVILYPLGTAGELITIYSSVAVLNQIRENAGFIMFLVMAIYPFGFYMLYTYMWRQRSKVLGHHKKDK